MGFKIIQFTDSRYYITKNGHVYSVKNLKYLRRDISHSWELRVMFKSDYDAKLSKKYIYNILIANGLYNKDNIPRYTHKAELYKNTDDVNILTAKDREIEIEILKDIIKTENVNVNIEKVKNKLNELGGNNYGKWFKKITRYCNWIRK